PTVGASAHLAGVEAISANDVWAVGRYQPTAASPEQTLTMHWNGTAWSVVTSPSVGTQQNFLWSVSGSSSNDVWAVGYNGPSNARQTLTLHWDGSQWTQVQSP